MAEQEQNRNEPATPFKIREAKKRGSVAKSIELNSFLLMMGMLIVLYVWGMNMAFQQLRTDVLIFSQAHLLNFEASPIAKWLSIVFTDTLYLLMPLFLLLIAIAIIGSIAQTGPVFSFFPLKPDIDRINPVSGLKRLFSLRMLFEAGKNIVKLLLFSGALYLTIKQLIPAFLSLLQISPNSYLHIVHKHASGIVFKLLAVLAVIAFLDALYTRWNYLDKLKMSRREIKEEIKRREGDPRVRARIRELQRELLKRSQAVKRVPEADVLITNPNHLAVALLYKRGQMTAPEVIAKGAGELAQQMKEVARRNRVPIVENRKLARALFDATDVERPVPEKLYPPVARILVWIYSLRENRPIAKGAH